MIRAAFIGIDRHQDPLIRDLSGAVRDATALWAILSDSIDGLHARLLIDDEATFQSVTHLLDETLGAAGSDDIVLLSFAGHGTPDHRLVFSDSSAGQLFASTLAMGDLATRFRMTKAKAVILFLDCCFSGGAPARVLDIGPVSRDALVPLAEVAGEGRVLFAASSPTEPALEDPQTRHGLFTKAIVDSLLKTSEPVSVIGLVDDVSRIVRAEAARLGYVQTPVLFGHLEGALTLPAGRRGDRYFKAFPNYGGIKTSGDFADLAGYGLPLPTLHAWRTQYPAGLNALQMAAINTHGVLNGNSLLVVAPTSAGKTFVGELAALKAICDGKRAAFLLPYKALVNEKYEDFSALYGAELDLRVVRCSGDWQDQVGAVLRGKYDIAFFTYEKFLALSVSAPHILNQIGLVVLDEAHFITDPGRGMAVELLLTHLVSSRARGISPQLVALSAVIEDTNGFDRWLNCELLLSKDRPIPLTEGVLDRSGVWRFVSPDGALGSEQLLDRRAIRQRGKKESSQDIIVPLVGHLVAKGEKVIVFRNRRGPAAGCAEYLARELGLPPAQAVIDALPDGDRSAMSERLRQALAGGVAFHTGDLNRDERVAVERAFRNQDGGVQVLIATSTVAAGINTPASTVVIVETDFPSDGEPVPYTVAQFKNMAGRAGRLGFETMGKAIALADSHYEANALIRRYVQGRPEPIRSSFDPRDPGTWVLRLLAQVKDIERSRVIDLIASTYGGYVAALKDPTWRATMAARLDQLLQRMIDDGLIEQTDALIRLTILGRACGESPLRLESAMRFVELLRRLPPGEATLEVFLFLIEALPERDEDFTPQVRGGEPDWQHQAGSRFGFDIARLLQMRAESDRVYYARCKRALIVGEWIDGTPIGEIEDRYSRNAFSRVGHGDVRGYADGSRFLLESALRIAGIVSMHATEPSGVETLLKRLDLGVPAEALPLASLPMQLLRGEILSLWKAGYTTPQQVAALDIAALQTLIGSRAAQLHEFLQSEGRSAA